MTKWLAAILIALVAWAAISLILSVFKLVIWLASLVALPVAIFVGYLAWKRLS